MCVKRLRPDDGGHISRVRQKGDGAGVGEYHPSLEAKGGTQNPMARLTLSPIPLLATEH